MPAELYPSLGADELEYDMATDLVSGAYYGYAKLAWGPDGSAYQVSSSTPLPIDVSALPSLSGQSSQTSLLTSIDGDTGSISTNTGTIAGTVATTGVTAPGTPAGIPPLFVQDNALSTLSTDDGDWGPPRMSGRGAVWTAQDTTLDPTNDGVEIRLSSLKTQVPYKYLRVTTTSGGVDVWDPTLDFIGVKWYTITWEGASACRVTLWAGTNADTTFSDGTDRVLFDINLAANANGGVTFAFPESMPWVTATADHEIHLTTSADKTVSIVMGGFEYD